VIKAGWDYAASNHWDEAVKAAKKAEAAAARA